MKWNFNNHKTTKCLWKNFKQSVNPSTFAFNHSCNWSKSDLNSKRQRWIFCEKFACSVLFRDEVLSCEIHGESCFLRPR